MSIRTKTSSTHRFDKSSSIDAIRRLGRVLVLIFSCELIVMVFLKYLPISSRWHVLLDPILLALLSTPLLYRLIVSPLYDSLERRRQAEQAAEEATKAKSDFLANMSHEIRTPMTAILGYTDILAEPDLSPSDRDNNLAVIRRNGKHLLLLINNILDLSKIEAGKLDMDIQPCNFSAVIADVASTMRARAQELGTTLSTEYVNALPQIIQTDGVRVRQAIVNIVGNALKFTENGSVRIVVTFIAAWSNDQPAIQIQVIDTGIGISMDKLSELFEPFVQADVSTSRKYGGTGLGLTITRRIADLLGGTLHVESTEGKGSTFTLIIPTGDIQGVKMLDSPAEVLESRLEQSHAVTKKGLAGLRILLAEDGIDNQRLISHLLRKAGAEVEIAEDGQVAVEKATAGSFDIVLMDMQMPRMDGYGATAALRKQGFDRPILALTAHAMESDRQKCLEAGCDDYMSKPVNSAKLIQTVAKHGQKEVATDQKPTDSASKPSTAAPQPMESEFADDPDFAEIIDQFVAGLAEKLQSMQQALANGDLETLGRLAHQLKGAGGSYGYSLLTDLAKVLEDAAKAGDLESAGLALAPVADLCLAIVAGRGSETISRGEPTQ